MYNLLNANYFEKIYNGNDRASLRYLIFTNLANLDASGLKYWLIDRHID